MRRARISCFMIMVLCFTMIGSAFFVQPVSATDPIPQIAQELSVVYDNLTVSDKNDISSARNTLNEMVYTDPVWDSMLLPICTSKVVSRFTYAADAKQGLIDFTKLLGAVTYPADGNWTTELNYLRNDSANQASFHTLFNNEASVDDFYSFLYATKQAMPGIIKNNTTYRNAVLNGTDAQLKAVISPITEQAMQQTVVKTAYAAVYNAFDSVDWNVSQLALYQKNLSNQVDSTQAAELALMKGYIRSQTKLVNATGVEYSTYNLTPGDTLKFNVIGQLMGYTSVGFAVYKDGSDVTSTWVTDTAHAVPASANGTYTVIGYRLGGGDSTEANRIFSQDVTVAGGAVTIKYGDTNGDGSINASDLSTLKQHILGLTVITIPANFAAADCNKDGSINASDLSTLKQHILGLNLIN